jgi:hypothetical protein
MEKLTDVGYEVQDGLAWITIDRPERRPDSAPFRAHAWQPL